MASINPSTPSTNQQLAGINNTVPMPRGPAPTLADGSPFSLSPNNSLSLGGSSGNGFVITAGTTPVPQAASTVNAGSIAVGGGTTPANGAQPAAPGTTAATAATTATTPTTASTETTSTPATTPVTHEGFGRADKNATMRVDVGGAGFSFPSFNSTRKSLEAPKVSWDPSWKRVEKDGMWYMEAPNGVKAIPAVEYRITPSPADKVQSVKVANGWGKKFPDGTILVFDRTEGAYRLDAKGNKHKVELGMHTFGGVKVRVFEASVVRTLDASGKVEVFDSRGNASKGSTRGRLAAALGAANAGASISGGGKTDSGPSTQAGGKPGMLVGGGSKVTPAKLTADVQHLTSVARGILDEVRSGNVDPARLAELQAQLNELPSGILQAAGAAGTMTSDGTAAAPGTLVGGVNGAGTSTSTSAGSSSGSDTVRPPGAVTASGGGASGAPVAGVDANATSKKLPAGSKGKVDITLPADLHGKQARFAQLPAEVQVAVAKAFGSNQGSAAFNADQLVAFSASGEVTLVEGGTVYLKHQAQVRGAGPGEDLAMTVRPGRQPGAPRPSASVSGGGNTTTNTTSASSTHGGNHGSHGVGMPRPAGNVVTVGGGATNRANRIELFKPGTEARHVDLGGINGSFTWRTLPAKAKAAILDFLRTETGDPAAKAFASRTGTGWNFDPNAVIVVEAGFAQFVGGLSMTRTAAMRTPTPPVSGGGASSQPIGHDATRPPVSGGGGIGAVSPTAPPPTPAVNDPGEQADGHNHTH